MGRCDLCLEGSLHLGQRRVFVEGGAAEPDRLRRAREQSRSGGHQHRVERDGKSAGWPRITPSRTLLHAPLLLLPLSTPGRPHSQDFDILSTAHFYYHYP